MGAPLGSAPHEKGVRGFLGELKRRNVFRVAIVYVITAWVTLQVADVLFPALQLPEWTLTLVAVLLLLGFPMALVFSWAFEITPDGLKPAHEVDPHASISRLTGRKLDFLIIGVLTIAVAFFAYQYLNMQTELVDGRDTVEVEAAPHAAASIAVLPFVNMSDDASNRYFSDGISEELLNTLTQLPDVKVAGRTSSFSFRDQDEVDLTEIGRRLNVSHILEGSVRKSGDTVRITAQLITAADGFHLWSKTYDTGLSDIFAVQENISRSIAEALQLELRPNTLATLGRPPTANVQAYDIYLQARALLREATGPSDFDAAITRFDEALHRDPMFVEAEAGKCEAQLAKYEELRDPPLARAAIPTCDRAATADPDRPEVQLALGALYHGTARHDFARQAYDRALSLDPDNADAHRGMGDVLAATGAMDEATSHYLKAIELAPGSGQNHGNFAHALYRAGDLDRAADEFREAIRLEPNNPRHYSNLGGLYYLRGDFRNGAEMLSRGLEIKPSSRGYGNAGSGYYYGGDFARAAEMYRRAVELAPGDYRWRGNLADACKRAPSACPISAEQHYATALEMVHQHLAVNPEDAAAESLRGLYAARLGRKEEALGRIERAMVLNGEDIDVIIQTAVTRSILDDFDGAATAIAKAIDLGYSPQLLRADPDLAPVFDYMSAKTNG